MSTPALENANRAGVGHWKHFHEIGDRYGVLRVSRIFVRGAMLNVFGLVWSGGVFMLLTHDWPRFCNRPTSANTRPRWLAGLFVIVCKNDYLRLLARS